MTIDLAQAAALHRRAVGAGMDGILPDGVRLDVDPEGCWGPYLFAKWQGFGEPITEPVATAAVTHWLREFCKKHTDPRIPDYCLDGLLGLADRIITQQEARNA